MCRPEISLLFPPGLQDFQAGVAVHVSGRDRGRETVIITDLYMSATRAIRGEVGACAGWIPFLAT